MGMTRPAGTEATAGPKEKWAGMGNKIKEKGKMGRGAAGPASDYGLNWEQRFWAKRNWFKGLEFKIQRFKYFKTKFELIGLM
jgi:hypothetical protein